MTSYAKFASAFNSNISIFVIVTVLFLTTGFFSNKTYSQETAIASAATKLFPVKIEKLTGPVALYPDELIGIVLPVFSS